MKRLWWILMFCLLFAIPTMAAVTPTALTLGTLEQSPIVLDFNGYQIETYNVLGTTYVSVFRLSEMGCTVSFDSVTSQVSIEPNTPPSTPNPPMQPTLAGQSFNLYNFPVFVGGFQTHAVESLGRTLIPVGSLRQLWQIDIQGTTYKMFPKTSIGVLTTATSLVNQLDQSVNLSIVDLYFENGFKKELSSYTLAPHETLSRNLPASTDTKFYISTILTKVEYEGFTYTNENMFGQQNDKLFSKYYRLKNYKPSSNLGDPIDSATIIWAEDTVNRKNLPSSTPYLVWTNIDSQRTYIFEGSNGNWKLMKHFICSTGKDRSPTPKGEFKLTYKVPYFGVEKGYRCKNAFGFIGTTYLYHSILYDKTGSYLLEGKGVLGTKASDGCIRFSPENSEWFYNNMLSGTKVWIN